MESRLETSRGLRAGAKQKTTQGYNLNAGYLRTR
jgi:hypothetical protein